MVDATLFVDVWGYYYRQILSRGWLQQIAQNCGCEFRRKVLVKNNSPWDCHAVTEQERLCAGRLADGSIDLTISAILESQTLMKSLGLKYDDFLPLVYQSLADLAAINHCSTKYMVFFCGDAVPWGRSNWVNEGIEVLEKKPEVMIVNPVWNGFYDHAKNESFAEDEQCYYQRGFSDQCYLARAADLRQDIYHEQNDESDRIYCGPHGNTFEKRVNAYMRNHGKIRVSLKSAAYLTRP